MEQHPGIAKWVSIVRQIPTSLTRTTSHQPNHAILGQRTTTHTSIQNHSPPIAANPCCTPSRPMLQELLKTLQKELELFGGGKTSVYTDLDHSRVRVTNTTSPNQRETTANSRPYYERRNSVMTSARARWVS